MDLWLDTTTEIAPFRLLTPNLRKKQALVVDAARRLASRRDAGRPAGAVDPGGRRRRRARLDRQADGALADRAARRR